MAPLGSWLCARMAIHPRVRVYPYGRAIFWTAARRYFVFVRGFCLESCWFQFMPEADPLQRQREPVIGPNPFDTGRRKRVRNSEEYPRRYGFNL